MWRPRPRCLDRIAECVSTLPWCPQMDLFDGRLANRGKVPIDTLALGLRERYLLYVQCLEAKPGKEPTHPYLYDLNH